MPNKELDTFFFWNSGAEAVEAAVKLARHATGKPNIHVFQGGYHGRTIGTMSLTTSKTIYKAGYGPLMPGVTVSPFPYAHQFKNWMPQSIIKEGMSNEELDELCTNYCLEQLRLALCQQASPNELAAVLIEPVQGEGGYVVPPKAFMQALRQVCDENGILLIADEVQSGFGRTGKFFAVEHFDIRPDMYVSVCISCIKTYLFAYERFELISFLAIYFLSFISMGMKLGVCQGPCLWYAIVRYRFYTPAHG